MSNNRANQIAATQEIMEQYDSDALQLLHQAQKDFNKQLKEEREKDHRDYLSIEAETRAVIAEAAREGETHIIQRHRNSAMIFFGSGNQIKVWEAGTVYDIMFDFTDFEKIPDGRKIISETTKFLRLTVYTGDKSVQVMAVPDPQLKSSERYLFVFEYLEEKNADGSIYRCLYCTGIEEMVIVDADFTSQGMAYLDHEQVQFSHGGRWYPYRPEAWKLQIPEIEKRRIYPHRVTQIMDQQGVFMTGRDNAIHKVDFTKLTEPKDSLVIPAATLGMVAGLRHNEVTKSLYLYDVDKMEIGIHILQPDEPQVWPTFYNSQNKISLPSMALPAGDQFTVSFLLIWDEKRPEKKIEMTTKTLFNLWLDPWDETCCYLFRDGNKEVKRSFDMTQKMNRLKPNEWFQLAWQKEGNFFRFFLNGELIHTDENAPDRIDIPRQPKTKSDQEDGIQLSCPGFAMAEICFWRTVRTVQQLRENAQTWLTGGGHTGLTGYWRLDQMSYDRIVTDANQTSKVVSELFPDLSGNGNAIPTQNIGTIGVMLQARNPFAAVIPLYRLKTPRPGIEVDAEAGKIYWVDELNDGRFYLMCGSTLGHTAPIPVFEMTGNGSFSVKGSLNSAYENLVLAHARRQEAIGQAIKDAQQAYHNGHISLMKLHEDFDAILGESADMLHAEEDNKEHYEKTLGKWLHVMDQINGQQERLTNASRDKIRDARERAAGITNASKERAARIRAERANK